MARTLNIPTRFTAKDGFSSPVARMGASVKGFAAKTEIAVARAERSFRRLNAPINKVTSALGGMGLFIGGTAIVGGMASMAKVFMDFEQANANLSSVMSEPPERMEALRQQALLLGATTSKTATQVVELQEAFARLGFKSGEIENMTKATIDGSVAMRGELAATAELVGAMVNTFDKFSSADAPDIIDQMTLATQKSALNFEKLQTSLPIVSGAANAAGVPFNRLLAILGKLSDAGIDASSSATALRNIFLESAAQGHGYEQVLENIQKNQDKLTSANDEFGKRAAVSASILANKLAETSELSDALGDSAIFKGTAAATADKQLQTLSGALTILESAYEGWILSMEDGTGALSKQLTFVVQVATDMLSLASGTATAKDQLNESQLAVRGWAETGIALINTAVLMLKVFLAWKAAILLTKGALMVYNAVSKAIFLVDMIKYIAATQGLTFAQAALAVAQSSLNAVMTANPIGLIVVAIAALIALVVVVISKWNEWGAALSLFLGPLGLVISLIQSFRRNWDLISQAFKEGGIVAGLKMIGKTILDAVLMPLQQLLEIIAKMPNKLGSLAGEGAARIAAMRESMGVEVEGEKSDVVSTKQAQTEKISESVTTQRQTVDINVNDPAGKTTVESDDSFVPVNVTNTR